MVLSIAQPVLGTNIFALSLPRRLPLTTSEGPLTWRQKGRELVEDLRVLFAPAVPHHAAHVQREGLEESTRGQVVKLQNVLHVVEVAQDQEVGPDTSHPL